MTKNTVLFILNANSGYKLAKILGKPLRERLERKFQVHFLVTKSEEKAQEAVQELLPTIQGIIIGGGDGTINSLLSLLVGKNIAIGIIPLGSGNALSQELGIYTPLQGLHAILKGKTQMIDCGIANGNYFTAAVGIGFDASISEKFKKRKLRGFLSYIWLALIELPRHKYLHLSFSFHGEETEEKDVFIASVSNTQQYGNWAFMAPKASIFDGYLRLCIIRKFPVHAGIPLLGKLFSGRLSRSKYYIQRKVTDVIIKGNFSMYQTDGEPQRTEDGTLHVKVIRKALPIYCLPPTAKTLRKKIAK